MIYIESDKTCILCGYKTSYRLFSQHLLSEHQLTPEQYYRKFYLSRRSEAKCLFSGQPTSFIQLSKGYAQFASKANRFKFNLIKYYDFLSNTLQSKLSSVLNEFTELHGNMSPAEFLLFDSTSITPLQLIPITYILSDGAKKVCFHIPDGSLEIEIVHDQPKFDANFNWRRVVYLSENHHFIIKIPYWKILNEMDWVSTKLKYVILTYNLTGLKPKSIEESMSQLHGINSEIFNEMLKELNITQFEL